MRRDLRILYASAAALILVLGGYLQYELRAFAPARPGEYWRTAAGADFADKDRPVAGAFCFAVRTMVKLTPAFVVPLFILRRQWRWLAAYTAWMTALFSISVWQLGWSNHVMFFTRFLPAMSCGFPSAANKSLMNIVQSLYYGNSFRDASHLAAMPPIVCAIGKALSAAVLIGVLIAFYRRTKDAAHIGYEVALP